MDFKVVVPCTLLALQYGLQPIISSNFTNPTISKASIVVGTEIGKILIAALLIWYEGAFNSIMADWSISNSVRVALLPASLYAIQNLLVQYSYAFLDSMTFNVLNQLKVISLALKLNLFRSELNDIQTISAAFWLFVLLGQKQSGIQMVSLVLLMLAAIILNMSSDFSLSSTGKANVSIENVQIGIVFVLLASLLSGLSAALTQQALAGSRPRHAFFFSAELAVYGILFIVVAAVVKGDKDSAMIMDGSLFQHWDVAVLLPVTTNVSVEQKGCISR